MSEADLRPLHLHSVHAAAMLSAFCNCCPLMAFLDSSVLTQHLLNFSSSEYTTTQQLAACSSHYFMRVALYCANWLCHCHNVQYLHMEDKSITAPGQIFCQLSRMMHLLWNFTGISFYRSQWWSILFHLQPFYMLSSSHFYFLSILIFVSPLSENSRTYHCGGKHSTCCIMLKCSPDG